MMSGNDREGIYARNILALVAALFVSAISEGSKVALNFIIFPDLGPELGISGFQYAILSSLGFSVVVVLCLIPWGRASDDSWIGRKAVIISGLLLQLFFGSLQAVAWDFWSLLVIRCGLAVGQAATTSVCLVLASESFGESSVLKGSDVFATTVYLGAGLGASVSVISFLFGWQTAFGLYGMLCGIAALAAFFALPGEEHDGDRRTWVVDQSMISLWFTSTNPLLLILAGSMRCAAGLIVATFLPIYFQRFVVEDSNAIPAITLWYGGIVVLSGCSSVVGGAFLSQFLVMRSRLASAPAFVAGIGCILAVPFLLSMLYARVPTIVILTFLFFSLLVGEVWSGPTSHLIQALLPSHMHSTGLCIYLAICSLLGCVGPMAVGVMIDLGLPLRHVLAGGVFLTYILAGVLFILLGFLNLTGFRKLKDEKAIESDDEGLEQDDEHSDPNNRPEPAGYQNVTTSDQDRIMV